MEFRVLGPVGVHAGDGAVPVPTTRVRTLLAALVLRANSAVTVDELVDALWGGCLPANPRTAVQTNVGRLRRALGAGAPIDTLPDGYLLRTDPARVDLLRFRALVARAHGTGGTVARHGLLRAALALWRGAPLGGVDSDLLQREEVPRLAEERQAAWEEAIELRLALGGHGAAVAELTAVTAAHPLRERPWGLLMLALYRDGRRADALGAYRALAARLVDEVGVGPTEPLRRLHRAILVADPALDRPAPPADPSWGRSVTGEAGPPRGAGRAALPPGRPAAGGRAASGGPPETSGRAAGCWWCAAGRIPSSGGTRCPIQDGNSVPWSMTDSHLPSL